MDPSVSDRQPSEETFRRGWAYWGERLVNAYNPQRASGRWEYLKSLVMALCWWCLLNTQAMALADWEEGISDAAIVWIGHYPLPLLVNLILFYTIAATIRRLHDMGWPGAGALLLCLPDTWFFLVPIALLWPSAPTVAFPRAASEPLL